MHLCGQINYLEIKQALIILIWLNYGRIWNAFCLYLLLFNGKAFLSSVAGITGISRDMM